MNSYTYNFFIFISFFSLTRTAERVNESSNRYLTQMNLARDNFHGRPPLSWGIDDLQVNQVLETIPSVIKFKMQEIKSSLDIDPLHKINHIIVTGNQELSQNALARTLAHYLQRNYQYIDCANIQRMCPAENFSKKAVYLLTQCINAMKCGEPVFLILDNFDAIIDLEVEKALNKLICTHLSAEESLQNHSSENIRDLSTFIIILNDDDCTHKISECPSIWSSYQLYDPIRQANNVFDRICFNINAFSNTLDSDYTDELHQSHANKFQSLEYESFSNQDTYSLIHTIRPRVQLRTHPTKNICSFIDHSINDMLVYDKDTYNLDSNTIINALQYCAPSIKNKFLKIKKYNGIFKILINGKVGYGTTTLARAFAEQLGRNCIYIDCQYLLDTYNQDKFQDLMTLAQYAYTPCVVIFDNLNVFEKDPQNKKCAAIIKILNNTLNAPRPHKSGLSFIGVTHTVPEHILDQSVALELYEQTQPRYQARKLMLYKELCSQKFANNWTLPLPDDATEAEQKIHAEKIDQVRNQFIDLIACKSDGWSFHNLKCIVDYLLPKNTTQNFIITKERFYELAQNKDLNLPNLSWFKDKQPLYNLGNTIRSNPIKTGFIVTGAVIGSYLIYNYVKLNNKTLKDDIIIKNKEHELSSIKKQLESSIENKTILQKDIAVLVEQNTYERRAKNIAHGVISVLGTAVIGLSVVIYVIIKNQPQPRPQ